MKIYSISEARKILGELVNQVKFQKKTIAMGQHGRADVLLIAYSNEESEAPLTELNSDSESFHFLDEEPDLYSASDLKKKYV